MASTASSETCPSYSTERAEFRICVSSVLASHSGENFGPEHLDTMIGGAWCAGTEAGQQLQSITKHLKPRTLARTVMFINGHAKSEASFRDNARVKRARIETDRGFKRTIRLSDRHEPQFIRFRKSRVGWVRMTILDVYPGKAAAPVCVSGFLVAVEEFP